MAEALGGFIYRYHWTGDVLKADWYAAPAGTPIGWPEGGTVYTLTLVGPEGPADPMEVAYLVGDSGWVYGFCHVEQIAAGRKEAWEPFARVDSSGIRSLPGEPSHIHFCASYGAWPQLAADGPTGTVPAVDLLLRMGFGPAVVEGPAPGPQDYLSGRAVAGRWV